MDAAYRKGGSVAVDRRGVLAAGLAALAITGAGSAGCGRRRGVAVTPSPDPPNRLYPAAAADLFQPGTRHRLETGDIAVSDPMQAGVLRLPTGRVVAVDPSWLSGGPLNEVSPFTVAVPPGAYPLTLALLRWTDLRVAAAKLTILHQPVTTWELALRPGQNPATLAPGYFFDVGVDAATIALFDAVVLDAVIRLETAEPTAFEVWHADRPVERTVAPGVNAIAFNTGWGDGGYPVWIGRTPDGRVGCFVVDMLMLAPPPGTATPWSPRDRLAHTPHPSSTA
jgi:hypothetical protein